MVELLDNKIVQPKKSIKNTHFYGLNYSIIQEFNPNKKYILYMSWVLFDAHFFEFSNYQIYFYQPRFFDMH